MAGAPQGYIGRNPSDGRTTINRQTFNVTSGVQTSFTFTSGYDLGYFDVYLNGIKQNETTDYTAADGSTFSFGVSTPAVQGDTIEAIAYKSFNTTNVTGSTRDFAVGRNLDVSGNVTIGSSLTIASDLVVNGTYTYVNTEILDIEDKTIGIASTSAASNTTADGGGIVVYGGSDGDKSLTWNRQKSNWVLVGGGVSIGTGCTIGSSTANVLEFSVDGAVNAKLNNYGAFIVGDGVSGEAWGNAYKTVQAGSGAFGGNAPAANAASYWTNNAYFDDVNSRWEYIAADEASRFEQGNGALAYYNASSGSADGAITWTERVRVTSAGNVGLGTVNPDSHLHIENGTDTGNTYIHVQNSHGGGGNAGVKMQNVNGEWTIIANDRLRFIDDDASAERLSITSAGKVGIGTDSPAVALELIDDSSDGGFYFKRSDGTVMAQIFGNGTSTTARQMMYAGGAAKIHLNTGGDSYFNGGNVGINEASPLAKLHVKVADSSASAYAHTALVVEDSDHTFIDIMSGTTGSGGINFGDSGAIQRGVVEYNHSSDYMRFITAAAERLRIDSSGRVIITNDSVTNSTGTNTQYAHLTVRGNATATSSRAAFINFARSEASANIAADEGIGEIWFGDQQAGEYAAIKCTADAAAAVGDYPGRLSFWTTADGGTTMSERVRIKSGGDINVHNTTAASTTDPVTVDLGGQYTADGSITNQNLKVKLYSNGANNDSMGITAGASGVSYVSSYNTGHLFYTVPAAVDTLVERLRITPAGYVGINEPSPACRLDVEDGASGGDGITEILRLNGSPNSLNDGIKINFARAGSSCGHIVLEKVNNNNTTDLIFSTRASNTVSESLRITGGGDVRLNGGALIGDDSALPTFTIANTDGNANNVKISLGESVGSDNGGITFYTAGASSSTARMRIRGNNNFIDILSSYTLRFNDGALTISHAGDHGYITAATGILHLRSDSSIRLQNESGSPMVYAYPGAVTNGVEFYQNGTLRAAVTGNSLEIQANHDLRLPAGNWTGEANGKIQAHSNHLYFQIPGNSGAWIFRLPNGTEPANINSSGTYSGSDERRKKDITTITNSVSTVKQLTGRSFTWKETDEKSFGVIAQEIETVLPDLVFTQSVPEGTTDTDPYKMVNYAALSGHFIEAIKELSAEVETLKAKVAALESA